MKLVYPAVFTPYEDGSEGYAVEFPDMPGCVTGGDDMAEAIFMAEDAASGWVLTELEDGKKAPRASKLADIAAEPGAVRQYGCLGYGCLCGKVRK